MTVIAGGCSQQQDKEVHPGWIRNAVIYEVNTRQITPQGTFTAFAAMLPELREIGVDVLWFMPIYPIGQKAGKVRWVRIIPSVITLGQIRNSEPWKIFATW